MYATFKSLPPLEDDPRMVKRCTLKKTADNKNVYSCSYTNPNPKPPKSLSCTNQKNMFE